MHHKAKKSLGQNFLKSAHALTTIVKTANLSTNDIVLEIGPGKGALTKKLLTSAGKVIAVEKDPDLIPLIEQTFAEEIAQGRLELVSGDILEFDPETLRVYEPNGYKVVANIPYYITGALIRMFLESTYQPKTMILLLQKEVAERIVARDNKESILSISVKAYGTPTYIEKVPKKYFSPEPSVDSAILAIDSISKKRFKDIEEVAFFEIVHAGFAHKRKTLRNNLTMAGFSTEAIDALWQTQGFSEKIRPEDITIDEWFLIAQAIHGDKNESAVY